MYPSNVGGQPAGQWQPGQDSGQPYKWDNTPDDDPEDDPNRAPPAVSGPPNLGSMEGYQPVQGYENVGFDTAGTLPYPPAVLYPSEVEKPPEEYSYAGNISDDEARDALIKYVSENCCYGSGPAKDMDINSIESSSALHYSLETFTESRATMRAYMPYSGYEMVDGPMNGMAPAVWDIICPPPVMFTNTVNEIEVPHTAFVVACHGCGGRGFDRCYHCYGRGRLRCTSCGASGHTWHTDHDGHRHQGHCHHCHGTGRMHCHTCGGDGRITCRACNGFRMLKHYIKLTVSFVNHLTDYILEKSDMPDELVKEVSGTTVFEQTLPYVWPVSAYPVAEINANSNRIVNEHRGMLTTKRLLQQRQRLRAVPVSEVGYKWKDTNTRFWVYGNEHKVHAPDYPQQCCCGCTII